MKMICIRLFTILALLLPAPCWSGKEIVITDPLYFEREHEVIFPWADAKLVFYEFEAVAGIEGGKQRARELHDLFLGKIRGLPGGAVLTYLTQEGQHIENYRSTARKTAEEQQAQMSLWGRMYPDVSGVSLINVRLELIEPPNGTQVPFEGLAILPGGEEQPIRGTIKDEVTQTRIDFLTVEETNIGALAEFLSGLAFYYKGAKSDSARPKRLLQTSIDHLGKYIEQTWDRVDYSAASAANLYIARAYYRLSRLDSAMSNSYLEKAEQYAKEAIEMNPYEADPYTVLAVVQSAHGRSAEEIDDLLAKAVSHAPGSATAGYNLALVKTGAGHLEDAIQRLEQVEYLQTQDQQLIYKDVGKLQDMLRTIGDMP